MYRLLILSALTVVVVSCGSSGGGDAMPAAPASAKAVHDQIRGKKYQAEKAGTHGLFKDDPAIEWIDPQKADKFAKEVIDKSLTLQLDFRNDTAVDVSYMSKTYSGTYLVDDKAGDDEKPGTRLRLSYADEEFKFGEGPASVVTFSYLVEGINEKSILLETPRGFNNRKIVVLMKPK